MNKLKNKLTRSPISSPKNGENSSIYLSLQQAVRSSGQNKKRMIIPSEAYDEGIWKQGVQFQIDYYIKPKGEYWKIRIQRLLDYLNPMKGEKILDLGCGVGTYAFHCAKRGAHGYGLDYSKESIKMAQIIASKFGLSKNTTYVTADAKKIPFENNFFDKVISADFVEHIYFDETKKVAKEIARVLKPGGLLVLYTPNRNPQVLNVIYQKMKLLLTFKNPNSFNLLTPTPVHIGLRTPRELEKVFRNLKMDPKIILFARVVALPFPLMDLWRFFSEKFFLTKNMLGERILLIARKE